MITASRLAFVVLAHQHPQQVQRLAQRLSNTGTVYLHLDSNMPPDLYEETVSGLPNTVTLLKRERCFWGGGGIMQATLNGIEVALASAEPWNHLFFLSGQCYPIKTDAELLACSDTNRDISWVQHFPIPSNHSWQNEQGGMLRFTRYHFYDAPNPFLRRWLPRFSRRGLSIPRSAPQGLPLYGGSQFWGLSHEAAQYISDFCRTRPGIVHYFRHVAIPDEHFIQTVIGSSSLANKNKVRCETPHYLAWDANTKRPLLLNDTYLPALLESPFLFARKFAEGESDTLLAALDTRNQSTRPLPPTL